MRRAGGFWVRILGVVLLAGLGAAWSRSERGGACLSGTPLASMPPAISGTAPDLTIHSAAGDTRLVDLRGKVVLIDFWATWCPPCRESIPHIAEVYRKNRDRGFEVLGVSLDDRDSVIDTFARENHIPYKVGRPSSLSSVERYGAESIPTMVLVDRQGRIRWRQTGYSDAVEKELAGQVDALLRE